jgi:hypothetical protein
MNFLIPMLLQAAGGAAGGNLLGSMVKGASMGTTGNTIAGALGGALGTSALGSMIPALGAMTGGGAMDIGSILANLVGGGVAGTVVQMVVGLIKNRMA